MGYFVQFEWQIALRGHIVTFLCSFESYSFFQGHTNTKAQLYQDFLLCNGATNGHVSRGYYGLLNQTPFQKYSMVPVPWQAVLRWA